MVKHYEQHNRIYDTVYICLYVRRLRQPFTIHYITRFAHYIYSHYLSLTIAASEI